jgi:sugar lactone lactonase YvrE
MGISVRRAAGGAVSVGVLLSAAFVATASSPALGAPAAGPSVTTVAGTGGWGSSGDGGAARHARLASPAGIAVDAAGDVAVADAGNCRVRMVAARRARHFGVAMQAQHIYSVAGTGCGRSAARSSVPLLVDPTGVAFDAAGDLLIADGSGNRILELPSRSGRQYGVSVTAGHLTTVAGTGVAGPGTSGRSARASKLDDPQGLAVGATGDLYIADTSACTVDEVPARSETRVGVALVAGHLYVVAGTGVCGSAGDGGAAAAAQLWSPSAVAVDGAGDILIADEGNSAVGEVAATAGTFYGVAIGAGDIATVAGQDMFVEYVTDGLSAVGGASSLNYPSGLALDPSGDLFIADSFDRCIREVPAHSGDLFGRTVVADDMYTTAGVLPIGGAAAGDGTRWVLARVAYPEGVAVGPGGALYFSDQGANTVRRIGES